MKYILLLVLAGIVTFPVASAERGAGPILVEMVEFAFHPATIRVRVGQSVMLRFVNRGQIAHQFVADYMRTVPVVANDSMMRVEVPASTHSACSLANRRRSNLSPGNEGGSSSPARLRDTRKRECGACWRSTEKRIGWLGRCEQQRS